MPTHQPQHDSLPPSEPDWKNVHLGVGQNPGIQGEGDFQWTRDGDPTHGTDIRRTPGRDHGYILHRWPNRPA